MAKLKRLKAGELPKDWKPGYTKVTRAGNVTEITEMTRRPRKIAIKRISRHCYIKLDEQSGEVYEYHHASSKADSLDSVRRTFARLRQIINANCPDPQNVLMITLTYRACMTDVKRLYTDYKNFWARLLYYCRKQGIPEPEYIAVAEPQARGAWHMHCLLIWKSKAPYIPNDVTEERWRHGFTHTQAVRGDCDNLGAYFTASSTDLTVEEFEGIHDADVDERYVIEKAWMDKDGTVTPKRVVKGARLKLYPSGMRIYRTSRGIVQPETEELTPEQAEREKANAGALTFSAAVAILPDDADDIDDVQLAKSQIVSKTYYNKKR